MITSANNTVENVYFNRLASQPEGLDSLLHGQMDLGNGISGMVLADQMIGLRLAEALPCHWCCLIQSLGESREG